MPKSDLLESWIKELVSENSFKGIGRFDPRVLEQEGINHQQAYKDWEQDCYSKLQKLASFKEENYKIPPIEHMVYFTSDTEAKELREEYVQKIIATANRLSEEDPNFQTIMWTNNPKIEDLQTIQEIKSKVPNIRIKTIDEYKDHPLYEHLNNLLQKGQEDYRFFVEASDIARILVITKHGGVYHDLDWEAYDAKAIVDYMKSFDYFNAREEHDRWDSFNGNAFIASKPNHPVPKKAEELMKRNLDKTADAPEYIHYPLNKFDSVICSTGPAMLNVAYHTSGNQEGNIDMVFPGNVLYNAEFARDTSRNKLSRGLPETDWKGIKVKTAGGDLFQGKWGDDYQKDIQYPNTRLKQTELYKVLIGIEKGDYTLLDEYIASQNIIVRIINILFEIDENKKASALISKVTDQEQLGDLLRLAIAYNQKEIFEQVLAKVTDQEELGEVIRESISNNLEETFTQILPKVTDQKQLREVLLLTIFYDRKEMFKQALPKVTNQIHLGKALKSSISHRNKEMFEQILPEVTDQKQLGEALKNTIYSGSSSTKEMFEQILPKVTDQKQLGEALKNTVYSGSSRTKEMFKQIISKLTDQQQLEEALKQTILFERKQMFEQLLLKVNDKAFLSRMLDIAKDYDREDMSASIEKTIAAIDNAAPAIFLPEGQSLDELKTATKTNDPLKLIIGAEATSLSSVLNHEKISAPPSTETLDKNANIGNNLAQCSGINSLETFNQNFFTGIIAFAFMMKTLGRNTDFLKQVLGAQALDVKMDFDPKTSPSHINSEYDYLSKIEEMAKHAPPLERAALLKIAEVAQTEEVAKWSKEQWDKFMQDDKSFKVFLDVQAQKAKLSAELARPLTQKDIANNCTISSKKRGHHKEKT